MTDVKDCTHDCAHDFREREDGTVCVLCACVLTPPRAATPRAPKTPRAAAKRAPKTARATTKRAPKRGGSK